MSKQTTGAHKRSIQAGIDTLNCRMLGIAAGFKNFLEEHQKVVKKQEAKKVRIAGTSSKGNFRRKVFPGRVAQQTNMHRNGMSGADFGFNGD